MLLIAIDGACRRNGKPDCVASGGIFIQEFSASRNLLRTEITASYEVASTNQRGEMLALLGALEYIYDKKQHANIVTDSEYLFNSMTKEWYLGWERNNWTTSTGTPVKNKDLWDKIAAAYKLCCAASLCVMFYHIKGHCVPFGKVTANTLLASDNSGLKLLAAVYDKYDLVYDLAKKDAIDKANKLSEKNNGYALPPHTLREFIVANVVVDAVANKCVEAADALM